jgi:hypothetical protein
MNPLANKVAIVTPSSLVRNWCKASDTFGHGCAITCSPVCWCVDRCSPLQQEFGRWLGAQRLSPFTVDGAKNKAALAEGLADFARIAKHQVSD